MLDWCSLGRKPCRIASSMAFPYFACGSEVLSSRPSGPKRCQTQLRAPPSWCWMNRQRFGGALSLAMGRPFLEPPWVTVCPIWRAIGIQPDLVFSPRQIPQKNPATSRLSERPCPDDPAWCCRRSGLAIAYGITREGGMPGALEGVRVIDFGQYIAGPLAAMLLGDQGADVIRIDPPGGPRWNTPGNATWNRNKRSIALDLKRHADRETARQLVLDADVVIENFRPGVMDRLGLGAAAMTAADVNPRLIYCSLPGFGADDPRARVRAWE